VHLAGASQLSSGNGDIILFLPRNLAANIDAMVMNGGEGHIEADPALHLTVQVSANGSGQVHAMGVLNGGGAPLKLRTTAGKIRLKYLDSDVALHQLLVSEQVDRLNKRLMENGFPRRLFRMKQHAQHQPRLKRPLRLIPTKRTGSRAGSTVWKSNSGEA